MQYQQMSTNKNALRKKYRSLRNEISAEELEDKSLAIANNLSKLPIWGNQYFHVFLPILSLREVNTEFDGLLETDVALDYCVTPDTVYEFS